MLDKIIPLLEDKEYSFDILINNELRTFTKKGKKAVINFLIAFSKSIDLEQVYNMLATPAITEPTQVESTGIVEEIEGETIVKESIIKPKKNKKNGSSL